ncbi:MAG TPA: hypothetical protein VFR07_01820 [Mycobacteriales bacterium]|nr:hypothetical protein [Mycobacteriales bacterium]
MMRHRLAVPAAMLLVVLAGCSEAQEAGSSIASSAASQAARAAADQVRQQVCAQVQDRQLSPQSKQALGALLPAARAAGLPPEVTTPLDQIAQSGDQTPVQAVDALRSACASPAASPAPTP